jgi:competence protein ComFB
MGKINFYELDNIRNINEKRVWSILSQYLDAHSEVCNCRDCVLDIAVIVLNNIKPHYQVTDENIENRPFEKASDDEIYNEIERAVKIVNSSPHHI